MPKTCLSEGCNDPVFSNKYCQRHQSSRMDSKWLKSLEKRKEKQVSVNRTPIKKISKSQAKRNALYLAERERFLSLPENQQCAVFPWLKATTIHHQGGRLGDMLLDTRYWLGLSMEGHQWVEEHPAEAYARGWTISRLSIDQDDSEEN